jgi:hypothetical protein
MQPQVPVVNYVIMIENSQRPKWYGGRSFLWPGVLAVIIVVPLLLVLFGTWDWFIPFVDAGASAAIGRQVGTQHLHVQLGRITTIAAEGVHIANPTGFSSPEAFDTTNFAQCDQLVVQVDVWRYLRGGGLFLPEIAVDRPVIAAIGTADGATNYLLSLAAPSGETGVADNTASTPANRSTRTSSATGCCHWSWSTDHTRWTHDCRMGRPNCISGGPCSNRWRYAAPI